MKVQKEKRLVKDRVSLSDGTQIGVAEQSSAARCLSLSNCTDTHPHGHATNFLTFHEIFFIEVEKFLKFFYHSL